MNGGKIDNVSGAKVAIDILHNRVHESKTWLCSYKTPDASPLPDNGTLEFLVINGRGADLSFQPDGNGDIEVVFFENTVVSNNGTQLAVVNLNRERSLDTDVTVFRDPAITSDGDQLLIQFSSWSTGGPAPRGAIIWILRPNTNYLIRVINRAGSAQPISLVAEWHEE